MGERTDRALASTAESAAVDYHQIAQLTSRMGVLADARAWQEMGDLFTETVELDISSLSGGEPATISREQTVDLWRQSIEGLDASQHLIANHQVDAAGDEATCIAYFQSVHRLADAHGDPLFTLGGRYDFQLRRAGADAPWLIAGLVATAQWASGNQGVMRLAAQRARGR